MHRAQNVLEFNSARKWDARMSVIARNEKGATPMHGKMIDPPPFCPTKQNLFYERKNSGIDSKHMTN